MPTNAPLNDDALNQLFREARSYNGYLDKAVSDAQLDAIWELMKYGPTSANCLPARLVWCTSDGAKEKLAALVAPTNADKVRKAPVTVIIGMDMEFYEQLPELFPARALGLDTGAMSGFNNVAVDDAFFAGTKVKSNFISTLGYGDPASIFPRSPRPAFDRFNTIA
jgi:3-hydroxypropanoate dehydrogenase